MDGGGGNRISNYAVNQIYVQKETKTKCVFDNKDKNKTHCLLLRFVCSFDWLVRFDVYLTG